MKIVKVKNGSIALAYESFNVPDDATHVAIDEDGSIYAFSELPNCVGGAVWLAPSTLNNYLGVVPVETMAAFASVDLTWKDLIWELDRKVKPYTVEAITNSGTKYSMRIVGGTLQSTLSRGLLPGEEWVRTSFLSADTYTVSVFQATSASELRALTDLKEHEDEKTKST